MIMIEWHPNRSILTEDALQYAIAKAFFNFFFTLYSI